MHIKHTLSDGSPFASELGGPVAEWYKFTDLTFHLYSTLFDIELIAGSPQ